MQMLSLDHINIRTSNLHQMALWYERVLGLTSGRRPNFTFSGAWLYIGEQPIIHLVDVDQTTAPAQGLQLEHYALTATGLKQFVEHLQYHDVEYEIRRLPGDGFDVTQVNIRDIDGNRLHIDFHGERADD